jgi:hypothetical protein
MPPKYKNVEGGKFNASKSEAMAMLKLKAKKKKKKRKKARLKAEVDTSWPFNASRVSHAFI